MAAKIVTSVLSMADIKSDPVALPVPFQLHPPPKHPAFFCCCEQKRQTCLHHFKHLLTACPLVFVHCSLFPYPQLPFPPYLPPFKSSPFPSLLSSTPERSNQPSWETSTSQNSPWKPPSRPLLPAARWATKPCSTRSTSCASSTSARSSRCRSSLSSATSRRAKARSSRA